MHKHFRECRRALRPGWFDPDRDIAGVTINRWAHGYVWGGNDLYDPEIVALVLTP
jgi:spermidine dehydrogenase